MFKKLKKKKLKKMMEQYAAIYTGFFAALGENMKMEITRVENKNHKGWGDDILTHFELAGFKFNNPKGLK